MYSTFLRKHQLPFLKTLCSPSDIKHNPSLCRKGGLSIRPTNGTFRECLAFPLAFLQRLSAKRCLVSRGGGLMLRAGVSTPSSPPSQDGISISRGLAASGNCPRLLSLSWQTGVELSGKTQLQKIWMFGKYVYENIPTTKCRGAGESKHPCCVFS